MIPFAGNKMWKLFLERFRYRHCCISVIMRPSGYFINFHLALGAIWFWDICFTSIPHYLGAKPGLKENQKFPENNATAHSEKKRELPGRTSSKICQEFQVKDFVANRGVWSIEPALRRIVNVLVYHSTIDTFEIVRQAWILWTFHIAQNWIPGRSVTF